MHNSTMVTRLLSHSQVPNSKSFIIALAMGVSFTILIFSNRSSLRASSKVQLRLVILNAVKQWNPFDFPDTIPE